MRRTSGRQSTTSSTGTSPWIISSSYCRYVGTVRRHLSRCLHLRKLHYTIRWTHLRQWHAAVNTTSYCFTRPTVFHTIGIHLTELYCRFVPTGAYQYLKKVCMVWLYCRAVWIKANNNSIDKPSDSNSWLKRYSSSKQTQLVVINTRKWNMCFRS